MKKYLIILFVLLVSGCHTGVRKPIVEELTVKELRTAIKNNPEFEFLYPRIREIGRWVSSGDTLRQAKFGIVTYKQAASFMLFNIPREHFIAEYRDLHPNCDSLRNKASSIIRFYKKNQPDSLVSISFVQKTQKHRTDDVIGHYNIYEFIITPLKGEINRLDFKFDFRSEENFATDSGYCQVWKPISEITSIKCSTNYVSFKTTQELKEDYYFHYTINDVWYNGIKWSKLPDIVKECVYSSNPYYEWALDRVVKDTIDSDYTTFDDFYKQQISSIKHQKYPVVSELFEKYSEYKWYADRNISSD